jgi:hypothetical protein
VTVMSRLVTIVALLAPALLWWPAHAETGAGETCRKPETGWQGTAQICIFTSDEVRAMMRDQTVWRYDRGPQKCKKDGGGEACYGVDACTSGDETGTYYILYRAPFDAPDTALEPYGLFCVTAKDEWDFRVVTKRRVTAEFVEVRWPKADLVIQPPDGRTLVNFPTNFYTTLTEPVVEPVEIFGHTVEIEATPASYTWHWSRAGETTAEEDAGAMETSDPGAPYEEGEELEVSHEYVDAEVTVHPSVDVTYTGRYRVDGGEWQDIDQTLTVPGDPVDLEIIEARVHLVG